MERTTFKVTQNCDLGQYLFATSLVVNDTSFSSKIKNVYWFPDKDVKAGDLIVLYTKKGDKNSIVNDDGSNTHFFYLGLNETISEEKLCVVLLEASSWRYKNMQAGESVL